MDCGPTIPEPWQLVTRAIVSTELSPESPLGDGWRGYRQKEDEVTIHFRNGLSRLLFNNAIPMSMQDMLYEFIHI